MVQNLIELQKNNEEKKEILSNQNTENQNIDRKEKFKSIPKWEIVKDVDDGDWDF